MENVVLFHSFFFFGVNQKRSWRFCLTQKKTYCLHEVKIRHRNGGGCVTENHFNLLNLPTLMIVNYVLIKMSLKWALNIIIFGAVIEDVFIYHHRRDGARGVSQ